MERASCPFVCWEPRESVLDSIRQGNPGAMVYCLYRGGYEMPRVKEGLDVHFINVESLKPSLRRETFEKTEQYHEPKPNLVIFLAVDQLLTDHHLHEAFYVGSTTNVYFTSEYLLPQLRREYRGLASPYLGKGEMSLSFMYIANAGSFGGFVDWMISSRHLKQPEEKTACLYWLANRTYETDFLPCVSNECDVRESDVHVATNHGTEFRGVWDNGSYGMFMKDARENPTSAFPSSQFVYEWFECGDGEFRPMIYRHGNSWPLYTLVT